MSTIPWSRMLVFLACTGLLIPAPRTNAADPAVSPKRVNAALSIRDVALASGGSLHGVCMDSDGRPLSNVDVMVSQLGHEVARTQADEAGRFSFQGLRGGLHLVRGSQAEGLYRFWAAGTAPPHATSHVTLTDSLTVRGQRPIKELFTSNAVVIGLLVAGVVAIPLAVHDARNDKKSGS